MKSWSAAFTEIHHRSAMEVRASVAVEEPFNYDSATNMSEIPDFIEMVWDEVKSETNSIISLPGRDMNFATDLMIAANKFYHVVDSVRSHIKRKAVTWAIVDAYHASLVGTRLVSALYGVLTYTIQGRTVAIDFRPELGRHDYVKKFKKDNKQVTEPIRLLKPSSLQLSQSDSWALCGRLFNITVCPEDEVVEITKLKSLVDKKISAFRNSILYDSVSWLWSEDFSDHKISDNLIKSRIELDDQEYTLTLDALCSIYSFVTPRFNDFCSHIGVLSSKISGEERPLDRAGILT